MNGWLIWGSVVALSLVFWAYGGDKQGGVSSVRSDFSQTVGNTSFEMVFVEGGTFTMGCVVERGSTWRASGCGWNERPAQSVTVSDFYIGKYEVTQRQWVAVMGNNPSYFKGDDLPVENISWHGVQVFITKLNSMTGRKYRLATEAEWEYAARGGNRSGNFKYSGSNNIDEVAWYYENSGDSVLNDSDWDIENLRRNNNRTHPVGTKKANELGIYDMTGNVLEWVNDWYWHRLGGCESGTGNSARCYHRSATDPTGPESGSDRRVVRGGSWVYGAQAARVLARIGYHPSTLIVNIGFRLALSP